MFTYLEELTVTEAEQVRKTIQALFRQTCILQVKYDPATLTPRDNPQYEICARHRGFIENYIEVLGCELIHDAQEHIFRLSGEHMPRENLSLTSTVILLLVRLIFRDRIMGEGLLWGAALDVTVPEPLPPDSPLWDIPNLLITPHVAGGMRLEITRRACIQLAQENLRRYLAGEPLVNRVR